MSNILLINNNIEEYEKIVKACNENTHPITYNELTDTYESLFEKYQNVVNEPSNNIETINHVAIASHGNPNISHFTFLEKEEKMKLCQTIYPEPAESTTEPEPEMEPETEPETEPEHDPESSTAETKSTQSDYAEESKEVIVGTPNNLET